MQSDTSDHLFHMRTDVKQDKIGNKMLNAWGTGLSSACQESSRVHINLKNIDLAEKKLFLIVISSDHTLISLVLLAASPKQCLLVYNA